MIELADLRVFLAAAEEHSFSRAAERLHLSQSAISQNIQALEKELGLLLFVRHGRSVWLSESGQALLPLAQEVINSSRLLEEAMGNVQTQVAGEMAIGCSTTSGKYLLPGLIANFRQEYPDVRARVLVQSKQDVIDRLLDERLPLGVVSKRIDNHYIEHQPLFEDRVILIVHPSHPWARYGRALPSDLMDQPLIMREEGAGTTDVFLEGLAAHAINPNMLNIVLEIGNSEAIEMAVEEGIGIAFISELAAARGLAMGRIRKVDVIDLDLHRTIYMARNMQRALTRVQSTFWSFVKDNHDQLIKDLVLKITQMSYRDGSSTGRGEVEEGPKDRF